MSAALIRAEALRPRRDDGSAFDHPLTLEVATGETVCLVGPNGGGKTAYLRALAAVDLPAAGKLEIFGQDPLRFGADARRGLRMRAAFVGEGAPLLSVVNGLINVTLPAMYHRLGNATEMQATALEILKFLDYPGRQDLLPAYLNQHERLLLAIARCLMLSPEAMFLDEPFHMTDNACRERESAVFRKLVREKGMAVFIATHNLAYARKQADRIVFLHPAWVGCFESWKAFADSGRAEVRNFLDAA